jgi:hypothetical protein
MTIRRGEQWGEAVASPPDLFVAPTDAAARTAVVAARSAGTEIAAIGFAAGDMARTMGGGAPGRFPGTVTRAPIDIVRVEAGGERTWAVAHVVARGRGWAGWWRGEVLLAMNAQFHGGYDVAPRAHPNDGRLDLVRVAAAMGLRTRLQARRRARTGTHLPHPQIDAGQAAQTTVAFSRPLEIWVDGVHWRRAGALTLTVEPDALVGHA